MGFIGDLMEVILYVQDMNAQVSFYRDKLGLTLKEPQDVTDFSEVYWVEFDTGACILALHAGGEGDFGKDAPGITFRVTDIEAARNELIQRGVAMGEVNAPAPGHLVADGRDAEGNRFSIESQA